MQAFVARLVFLLILLVFSVFNPQVLAQNDPPIADAGPDQTIYVGEYTVLQGSAWDPNQNDIVEWLWTVESAPSSPYMSDLERPDPLFQADMAGEYVLSLIASDGMDWSEPDYVTITVLEILPPVAIATANVTIGLVPLTVNFNGSQSYPRYGTELLYLWNFGDQSGFSTEVSPTHVYVLPNVYTVELTVFDSLDQADIDTILITVYAEVPWDLTGPDEWVPDGKCDIRDVAIVALRFGSEDGDPIYDARADITGPVYLQKDEKIDIRDVALVAIHFGE